MKALIALFGPTTLNVVNRNTRWRRTPWFDHEADVPVGQLPIDLPKEAGKHQWWRHLFTPSN